MIIVGAIISDGGTHIITRNGNDDIDFYWNHCVKIRAMKIIKACIRSSIEGEYRIVRSKGFLSIFEDDL